MTRTQYLQQVELLRQTMITVELETRRRYPIGQRCKWVRDGKRDKIVKVANYIADYPDRVFATENRKNGIFHNETHVRELIPIDEQGNEIE